MSSVPEPTVTEPVEVDSSATTTVSTSEPEVLETIPLFDGKVVKKILRYGTGTSPLPGSIVTCHYVGRLKADGTLFDSSRERDQPFQVRSYR